MADDSSQNIKVRPGAELTIEFGPKKMKKAYKIKFSTPVVGKKPSVTLQQGGFFTPAIQGKDIHIGVVRAAAVNDQVNLGPRKYGKKTKSGCMGRGKTTPAKMHG